MVETLPCISDSRQWQCRILERSSSVDLTRCLRDQLKTSVWEPTARIAFLQGQSNPNTAKKLFLGIEQATPVRKHWKTATQHCSVYLICLERLSKPREPIPPKDHVSPRNLKPAHTSGASVHDIPFGQKCRSEPPWL